MVIVYTENAIIKLSATPPPPAQPWNHDDMAEETCFAITTFKTWWPDKKLIKYVESFKRGIVKFGGKILGDELLQVKWPEFSVFRSLLNWKIYHRSLCMYYKILNLQFPKYTFYNNVQYLKYYYHRNILINYFCLVSILIYLI